MDRAQIEELQKLLARARELAPRLLQIAQNLVLQAEDLPSEGQVRLSVVPTSVVDDARSALALLEDFSNG